MYGVCARAQARGRSREDTHADTRTSLLSHFGLGEHELPKVLVLVNTNLIYSNLISSLSSHLISSNLIYEIPKLLLLVNTGERAVYNGLADVC